jgi:hypothetical protein
MRTSRLAAADGQRRLTPSCRSARQPHVVALGHLGEKERNILGKMLQVSVHRDHDRALGMLEAGLQGCRLTVVATQYHHRQPGVRLCDPFGRLYRIIDTAIVDTDELERVLRTQVVGNRG